MRTLRNKAFCRKLLIAYLIESGINTVPMIIKRTGFKHRTVQDTIANMSSFGIEIERSGSFKDGIYIVRDWGVINKKIVKSHIDIIFKELDCK